MQINIRGLNNIHKFDYLLECIDICKARIDIIVISETWLKEDKTALFQIKGFSSVHVCRTEINGGGLSIFVRNELQFHTRLIQNISEFHHVHLEIGSTSRPLHLHAFYRPPSQSHRPFLKTLEDIISSCPTNGDCIVVGDINIPVNKTDVGMVKDYDSLITSYNFAVTNDTPTRPASGSILDHSLCSHNLQLRVHNDTICNDVSDHSFVITTINNSFKSNSTRLEKTIINHRAVLNEFSEYLANVSSDLTPSEKLASIIKEYQTIKQRNSRLVAINAKLKAPLCPWMTVDVWMLSKMKDNALKRCKRKPNDERLKSLLKHVSNKLVKSKRHAKRKYFENLLNTPNQKLLWSRLNEVLGRNKKRDDPIELQNNDQKVIGNTAVSSLFNEYFCSVGSELASKIVSDRNIEKFRSIKVNPASIFLRPATREEVTILIAKLNPKKARGPDDFPAELVKQLHMYFAELLRDVFNESLTTGIYPDFLKVARVTPIYKTGNKEKVENYRPIAVLSVFNKIMEQLLANRMSSFFEKHKIIYHMQYGFRSGSSTSNALCELVESLYTSIEKKKMIGAVFIDLKKAFDTLDHEILLSKLAAYGIRGLANDLLRSYLSDRKQFVIINGTSSCPKTISVGVPQGSNLGPLLFLIYINDLPHINIRGVVRLFADDTAIFYEGNSQAEIIATAEEDFRLLRNYFDTNMLSLNVSKTRFMLFRSTHKKIENRIGLTVDGEEVPCVESFKYLGLIMDSSLTWQCHLDQLSVTLSRMCGILRKIAEFLPIRALETLYYAFFHSHLQQLTIIWGSASNERLKRIQVLQNRSLKTVYSLPHMYSSSLLFTDSRISVLPVRGLYHHQLISYTHAVANRVDMHTNMHLSRIDHNHHTRRIGHLSIPRPRTNYGKRKFAYMGPFLYNRLPATLKNSTSMAKFKKDLKLHMKSNVIMYLC